MDTLASSANNNLLRLIRDYMAGANVIADLIIRFVLQMSSKEEKITIIRKQKMSYNIAKNKIRDCRHNIVFIFPGASIIDIKSRYIISIVNNTYKNIYKNTVLEKPSNKRITLGLFTQKKLRHPIDKHSIKVRDYLSCLPL